MVENWTVEMAADYISSVPLDWVDDVVAACNDGAVDPLLAYTRLLKLGKLVEESLKTIQPMAISEAQKHKKVFQLHGCEIQNRSVGGKWDFKHLQDWSVKKIELEEIEEKHKTAFKMAEKGDTYISDGGEVIEPATYTPGKDTIAIKFIQ